MPRLRWVFIDTQVDSINDVLFGVYLQSTSVWSDLPASYHGGSEALLFAAGHSKLGNGPMPASGAAR